MACVVTIEESAPSVSEGNKNSMGEIVNSWIVSKGLKALRTAVLAATVLCSLSGPLTAQAKQDLPGQDLGIASVVNLRDIGGYATSDGAVVRTKFAAIFSISSGLILLS